MTPPQPDLPPPLADLLVGVGRAFGGAPDAIEDVVTDDVVWVDDDARCDGVDEVVGHFLAHGGWREVFEVRGASLGKDRQWTVDWTLWLRADATSYRRDGRAEVVLADDRIASWTTTATEREDGSLAPWGGDRTSPAAAGVGPNDFTSASATGVPAWSNTRKVWSSCGQGLLTAPVSRGGGSRLPAPVRPGPRRW